MSLLYRFKPQRDRSLRSVTTHLDGARVTANEVTALGLCLALGAGRLAYYGHLYTGLILFAAGVVCDALDGSFARISTMGTEFGLYFDGVADRFSELFFVSDAVLGAHVPSSAFVLVGVLSLCCSHGSMAKHVSGVPCPLRLGGRNGLHVVAGRCALPRT